MDQVVSQTQPVKNAKLQSIILAAAFILFVLVIIWGIFSGVALGKDKATYKNVETLNDALHFYYSDQDRFPTANQFSGQSILLPFYMSAIPKPENAQGACKDFTEFKYSQDNSQSFNLQFCLVQGTNGLSKGLHTLTEKAIQ